MAERRIKQAWVDHEYDVMGAVAEDGTLWRVFWRELKPVWQRVQGPPADPPAADEKLPDGVGVGRFPDPSGLSQQFVNLRVGASEIFLLRSEARAIARALLGAAQGEDVA